MITCMSPCIDKAQRWTYRPFLSSVMGGNVNSFLNIVRSWIRKLQSWNHNTEDFCVDRDAQQVERQRWTCSFVNKRRCIIAHITAVELLEIGLNLLCSHGIQSYHRIQLRANANAEHEVIHKTVARTQTQHREALVIMSRDLNLVTLKSNLCHRPHLLKHWNYGCEWQVYY